ncbi:MAG: cytochrome P460 family protein [Deltaproteobacteria bacterium]
MKLLRTTLLTLPLCFFACSGGDDDGGDDTTVTPLPDAPLGGNHALAQFPTGYNDAFTYTTTVDKESNNQVRDMYANNVAINSASGAELDRGSVIVMEIHGAKVDGDGNPILDARGRFIRDSLNIVAVMEKQEGFGQYSAATKNGEWEYAFYNPDGTKLESEADCYGCHLENTGAATDFVFSIDGLRSPASVTAAPNGGDPTKVTYPADYESTFTFTTTVDKASNNQVRDVYANDAAIGSAASEVLARGSVLVMEVYGAQLDMDGNPVLDENGRYTRGELAVVAVSEKLEGNGQYRPDSRNGEWEYAFFSPSGEGLNPDADCFGCHLENTGTATDFIFTRDALSNPGTKMLPAAPVGSNTALVQFPEETESFTMITSVDKASNNQVREIFANDVAMTTATGEALPRGSILRMDIYAAILDGNGDPMLDGNGAFMKGDLAVIAISHKKKGYGQYSTNRNGEWEYAFFTPMGEPMESEADCYGCHAMNAGESMDFMFSRDDL